MIFTGKNLAFLFVAVFTVCISAYADDEPSLLYPSDGKDLGLASTEVEGTAPSAARASGPMIGPVEVRAEKADLSLPQTWVPVLKHAPAKIQIEVPNRPIPGKSRRKDKPQADPLVQNSPFSSSVDVLPNIPSTSANFEGINNIWSVYPPDTNGAAGTNHFVQTVNLGYAVYNKTGGVVQGTRNTNTIWSNFGGPCEGSNSGDPIVLHDQLADRWLISQFKASSPYYQCVAVSQTSDPTGAYYRYAFLWSSTLFNDYPHFGVWPDGYYMSVNEFSGGISFAGAGAAAFERDRMLVGDPNARMVAFHQINDGGQLATDLDGTTLPPAGTPNFFCDWESGAFHIWKFHVDWNNTANSSFTNGGQISVAAFDSNVGCSGRNCIPQPNTTVRLDAITDRYMFRLAYRNLGTHQSLVTNHTVDAGTSHAGVRWYEVRNPNGAAVVHQQGTYAPDAAHRWMGSVAMDKQGNMGLGYSVASTSIFPSIRYTGRLVSDPLGTMPQGEATIIAGGGSQTGTASRWGDYSSMAIDPVDDCTFWYTTEYYQSTGQVSWRTRIASFKFPGCDGGGPGCNAPSSLTNNSAADVSACADSGVRITWAADPGNWGDSGGTRTYDVLRNGVTIASGLPYGTTSYVDTTGANATTYTYSVRYNNACGSNATTTGASAADNTSAPVTQTANQSVSLTAKNQTKTTTLVPAFTIAAGQATSASVTWSLTGNTNLTTCTSIRLRAPDGTLTTLKAAGASNTGSANVLSFYNAEGPGTYSIILQENAGCSSNSAKATLSNTRMTVQRNASCP